MPKPPKFANEDEIKAVIRERIKSERTKSKIDRKDIAGLLQLDISAISNIENGKRDIQLLELFLIAELLEVPIDSFFPAEAKRLVQKAPKHLDIFNLLPEQVRMNVCLSQEAVGSISSSQLYALLEIFKNNPWGKIRGMVATIFPLLRDTWVSSRVIDEMDRVLLPNQGEKTLRYHTRLLAADVLSAFIWSSDGHELSARGRNIQTKIEQYVCEIRDSKDFECLFWLKALSNLGIKNISTSKMDSFYSSIKNQIQKVTVHNLIFVHQWGSFYKKDRLSAGKILENCLNMIATTPATSVYDFSLKVWGQSLKTLYYPDREDWLEHIFDDSTYQELTANEQATIIIISLCSAADELDNLEKGGKDRSQMISLKKIHVRRLYDKFTSIYDLISSSFIKIWSLQIFLFLRSQQINQSRYIDIQIQDKLENIFNDVFNILKSSSNPLAKALALDFILKSRIPSYVQKALQITFELIYSPHSQDKKLFSSLLIDVFCRIDGEIISNNNPQTENPNFAEFCKNPFEYMCRHFDFDISNPDDSQLLSIEESWVCSAILRLETSASAYKYFLSNINTISCKSLSYNHMIGDAIGGSGIRYDIPVNQKDSSEDDNWWIWRFKDDDGDIYTLYSYQIGELTISRFVNEYSPKDSGFILFNKHDFLDGFYVYNSHERPFWGGLWTIEDASEN